VSLLVVLQRSIEPVPFPLRSLTSVVVLRPRLLRVALGVLAPTERVAPPTAGDEVEVIVAVDVEGDGREIVVILAVLLDLADVVFLAEVGALIPERARDDVEHTVVVDVEHARRLVAFIGDPLFFPFYGHALIETRLLRRLLVRDR